LVFDELTNGQAVCITLGTV